MKISINILYSPDSNPEFINAAKTVHQHYSLPITYWVVKARHPIWMDHVMNNTDADIVGFLDIDCIPLSVDAVPTLIEFVRNNKSIAGCAQATNHIPPMSHIFIGPCCFFIWKPLWEALGKPSFLETPRSDVCQEICYLAEQNGVRMLALYPTFFEREPQEGVWRLHNYGLYGIGTTFQNKFYHLYQSRFESNIDLFIQRCRDVITGRFNTDTMHSSLNFNFAGRVCKFPPEENLRRTIDKLLDS
jgi:hypothetical protein